MKGAGAERGAQEVAESVIWAKGVGSLDEVLCWGHGHVHLVCACTCSRREAARGVAARRVLAILHLLDMSRHTAEAECAGRGAEAGELERLITHGGYDFLFS